MKKIKRKEREKIKKNKKILCSNSCSITLQHNIFYGFFFSLFFLFMKDIFVFEKVFLSNFVFFFFFVRLKFYFFFLGFVFLSSFSFSLFSSLGNGQFVVKTDWIANLLLYFSSFFSFFFFLFSFRSIWCLLFSLASLFFAISTPEVRRLELNSLPAFYCTFLLLSFSKICFC